MGYSDPTSSRDLLGNRSLCFIFICAFGLVTLFQQILYGKNYIKRYLERSEGSLEFNSTSCKELRQEITDVKVLTMVKTSELFERWRNLQVCKWEQNKEETDNFKMSLSRCCNAPSFLFTTKRNTPSGTKLRYEVDTSGILHISPEIFKMFPDDMPYSKSQFKKCAVIGNGGIIKNSKCGREIDAADFVFRCNIPPISDMYSEDVGSKTDLVTVNPSIITERYTHTHTNPYQEGAAGEDRLSDLTRKDRLSDLTRPYQEGAAGEDRLDSRDRSRLPGPQDGPDVLPGPACPRLWLPLHPIYGRLRHRFRGSPLPAPGWRGTPHSLHQPETLPRGDQVRHPGERGPGHKVGSPGVKVLPLGPPVHPRHRPCAPAVDVPGEGHKRPDDTVVPRTPGLLLPSTTSGWGRSRECGRSLPGLVRLGRSGR
uniref:ST8 alpha-N-acetyl-neuraminide alpha-2,8-sialyltransferase 5 n=1 Tax=Sinocyclocheilus grahami TaxID=75366 RepID=A0A672RNT4_SINGR